MITEYKGSHEKITTECLICGHIYDVSATNLLSGKRCPACADKLRAEKRGMPKEIFLDKIKKRNLCITILSEYQNLNHKLDVKCNICGREWKTYAKTLLNAKYGCDACAKKINGKKAMFSQHDFEEIVCDANPNIKIIGQYAGYESYVKVQCKECGHIWNGYARTMMTPNARCPVCIKKHTIQINTLDNDEYVERVHNLNPDVEVVSKYTGGKKQITLRCRKCGRTWTCWAENAKTALCSHCSNKSRGEDKIKDFLEENRIDYTSQKKFDELVGVNGRKLSYDFYIPDLNMLIEFNGLQHYKPIPYFGGDNNFKIQKEHDRRKSNYALSHGYVLLEIPYTEIENIETILFDNLKIA